MGDAEAYLRRVSLIQRQHFVAGYASATPSTAASASGARGSTNGSASDPQCDGDACLSSSTYPCRATGGVVVVDLNAATRAPALPMKRRTKRSRSPDVKGDESSASHTCTQPPPSTQPSRGITAASDDTAKGVHGNSGFVTAKPAPTSEPRSSFPPPLPSQRKRVSLIDKWFPGNTLKEATLQASQAPTVEYVQSTVERATAARERMITLRSGVEDLDELLGDLRKETRDSAATTNQNPTSVSPVSVVKQEVRRLVSKGNWRVVREALQQFAITDADALHEARRVVGYYLARKASLRTPSTLSVKQWHEFLNLHGPEAGGVPTLSHLVWLSSANTTTLFTVLTQRFLRAVKEGQKVAAGEPITEPEPPRRRLLVMGEDDEEDGEGEQQNTSEAGNGEAATHRADSGPVTSWLTRTQPVLSEKLTAAQRQLLVFLRVFMPAAASCDGSPRCSAGFGQWLFASLIAIDTPLDPDTDRLAHELFRSCCDQVRVLGEWAGVQGEHRGALVQALPEVCPAGATSVTADSPARSYESLQDVKREDVLALYTIVIILAKFCRQNQNRLIPL